MNCWLVVVGAVMIQLALGGIHAWLVFKPKLEEIGWSKIDTLIVYSLSLAFFAIVMVFAGKKLTVWGPQRLLIIGSVLLGAGYGLASLFGGTNFIIIAIFIGVIGGSGVGFAYVVPIVLGMKWFPEMKGLIIGPVMGGVLGNMNNFGLSFTICGIVCLVAAVLIAFVKPAAKSS